MLRRCCSIGWAPSLHRRCAHTTPASSSAERKEPHPKQEDDVVASVALVRKAIQEWTLAEKEKYKKGSKGHLKASSPSKPEEALAHRGTTEPQSVEVTEEWIRNRRPKFWNIVYNETNPPVSGNKDSTEAPRESHTPTPQQSEPSVSKESSSTASPPSPTSTASSTETNNRVGIHHNKHKVKVVKCLCDLLSVDSTLSPVLLQMLSPESRRLLVIMGTATEYFGEQEKSVILNEIKKADLDKDFSISSAEYDAWATNNISRRKARRTSGPPTKAPASSTVQETTKKSDSLSKSTSSDDPRLTIDETLTIHEPVVTNPKTDADKKSAYTRAAQRRAAMAEAALNSLRVRVEHDDKAEKPKDPLIESFLHILEKSNYYRGKSNASKKTETKTVFSKKVMAQVFLTSAAPFFAFGFLDNSSFVIAGDQIDTLLQTKFNLNNSMVAAGFGGVVSGVFGIQVHGLAERWTRRLAPEIPLTPEQRKTPQYFTSVRRGNATGMVVGLLCGLTPLLVLDARKTEEDEEIIDTEHKKLVEGAYEVSRSDLVKKESKTRQYTVFEEAERRKELLQQFKTEMKTVSHV